MIQGFSIPQPGERGYGTDEYDLVVVGRTSQTSPPGATSPAARTGIPPPWRGAG